MALQGKHRALGFTLNVMLDLKQVRINPEAAVAALARRADGSDVLLSEVLKLDEQRRELLPRLETLRAQQNAANDQIAEAKKSGGDADAAIAKMREVAGQAKQLSSKLQTIDEDLQSKQARLPNIPQDDAPLTDTVIRTVGEAASPVSNPLDHLDLAGPSRIDMERGANLSGSRFAYLRGELVFLELALVQWALDKLRAHGHEAVIPPVLVREQALYGTGFLPDTEQQIYHLPEDDLYLVGTSEVALASMHQNEILDAKQLPLRYAGFSPCFRREAGAAGRDTRGVFRVHQFDKVEMFSFVEPDRAEEEHQRLLAIEEEILNDLKIPYQVVDIAVDDLGGSAARKFDCEAWLPAQGKYRELTSTSNTSDFQARRLQIRYRPDQEAGKTPTAHVATLNGTAIAVGRTIVAILENGQQEDGSVLIPECLHSFGAPKVLPAATK